jgi:hypothetical protein
LYTGWYPNKNIQTIIEDVSKSIWKCDYITSSILI